MHVAPQNKVQDEKVEFLASDLESVKEESVKESVKEESKRNQESQNNESETSSCNLNMSGEFTECLEDLFSPKQYRRNPRKPVKNNARV